MTAVVAVPRELTGDGRNRASVPRRESGERGTLVSRVGSTTDLAAEALRPMSTELSSTKLSCTSS